MGGLRNLTLKTKLLLMMLSLLILSLSASFLHHLYDTQRLLAHVREYTEDLSTAVEVFQEQPVGEGDPQEVLKAYMEKLGQLGVRDVSISDTTEVQASTDPEKVGKGLVKRTKPRGPKQWVIRGVLGEESAHAQRTSTLTLPIVVGDRRVGYLLITRHLDDFSDLAREAFVSRAAATLAVFALGILLSLYLSWSFSSPLHRLTEAAHRVAKGDLEVQVPPEGGGEIGSLARSFNEMVARLREQRVLEERLHFAERSTALGRLASAVAHEIRNPLNFVSLSIDHVRERLAPADAARATEFDVILGNVKGEINRLNRMVGEFLSFGRPMRLHPQECAIDVLLREVGALVDHKARDQRITLKVDVEPGLPRVIADPELLKTCFLNLMINGLDAMPDGGLLTASVRRDRHQERDVIVVQVTDSGHGMSEEEVRDAFEPYFSTKEAGLGIGLALTRKIVSDHGGSIELSSAPGRGTTALLRFPLPSVATAALAS
jgi:signal transduction histidine kinase